MWVVTLAPASRQTRAAARSKGGGSEGARPGARCAVVAVQVKGSTAPAGPLGDPEDMRRVHKFGKAKAKAGKGRLRVVRASPGNAKLRAAHQNSMGRHRGNGSGMEAPLTLPEPRARRAARPRTDSVSASKSPISNGRSAFGACNSCPSGPSNHLYGGLNLKPLMTRRANTL